jgi:dienelactone hydrolase
MILSTQNRSPRTIAGFVLLTALLGGSIRACADDATEQMLDQVAALSERTAAPKIYPAAGYPREDNLRAIYYDGLDWQGKPTRVFAWLGMPASATAKVPGVVLVHGGGGTAFKQWVKKWNEQGFAAISIAVEGQTDQRDQNTGNWKSHDWPGPKRVGIYGDSDQPLADQWMYHAVADTILANSLLRSLPQVEADKVGLAGISWGGVVTSTVIGIDPRFAFAIPIYGCGNLATAANQYGRALGDNQVYRKVWDPLVRMDRVKMPVLWLSWTGDQHFPLDLQRGCYAAAPGDHLVSLIPNMRHSHQAGWNPPDSYAFANSIVQTGSPWCRQLAVRTDGDNVRVAFRWTQPLENAVLISTVDTGHTGRRKWIESPARLVPRDGQSTAIATLPAGTTAWFITVHSNGLTASSDFQTVTSD